MRRPPVRFTVVDAKVREDRSIPEWGRTMTLLRAHHVSIAHRMHLDAAVRAARRAVSRHALTAQERANLRASFPAPTGIITASLGGHPRVGAVRDARTERTWR
jgi:hypothetical protein